MHPSVSLAPPAAIRGSRVRRVLSVIAWAMLRLSNEHSRAFRGRYDPDTAPWGVEIVESQYWPHVRTVDVSGPTQGGKTFHATELPTLYDLTEAREVVFYMNGSADNALNLWTSRWLRSLRADPVLRQQLLDRIDAGRWDERHLADGGLLYSAGPESAAALSQREARIVRCSELEKTKAEIGREASSYALAAGRAAAYPSSSIVVSDCTVTDHDGLTWKRFVAGDRSRPFIPCPHCGHYACPAHARHLEEADLALAVDTTHALSWPEISSASSTTTEEQATLACRACGATMTNRQFRDALRAVVWVPVGCAIVRHDNPAATPIPNVRWLDELHHWAALQLVDPDICDGLKDPAPAPEWSGPRLPDGVELAWNPQPSTLNPQLFAADPRRSSHRSFWFWRLLAPRYTIGQVAGEIVRGDLGSLDDHKVVTQHCLVLPYIEPVVGGDDSLNEDAVLLCCGTLPKGLAPEHTVAITGGIDISDDIVHAVKRAWTEDGGTYLVDDKNERTDIYTLRKQQGVKYDQRDARYLATRQQAVYGALEKIWEWLCAGADDQDEHHYELSLAYVDAGYMADEVYAWCAAKAFQRLRPAKGYGSGALTRRKAVMLYRGWNDACEKKALVCRDAKGNPLKHQYYDADRHTGACRDPRRLMHMDADHWKKELHGGIRLTALAERLKRLRQSLDGAQPWFFLHNDLDRNSRYVSQVLAERWETWVNPRTQKQETGWREYQHANHLLDCEGMAFAAAAALGMQWGGSAMSIVAVAKRTPRAMHRPAKQVDSERGSNPAFR